MLIAYAYEKVMDHKCYLFMPLKELETIKIHFLIINLLQMFIACLCLLNCYIQQVLIAYAYITVTYHKC